MRPLKLRMSAFGPYPGLEEIDFEKLNGQNIFLITGPTGAGKTTIFDAISFALFGEASGNDRQSDSFRSDFADEDRETFVELEFMFKRQIYIIRRSPQQLKKKKRGEGYTLQASDAALYLPDGGTITNTKKVTNKIEELLGINQDQFRQIVMLAQGEFKKLLLSDSKDRGSIFRKIFGTHDYQKIQLKLKDKATELKRDVDRARAEILTNLKGIISEDNIQLTEYTDTTSTLRILEDILEKNKLEKKELEDRLRNLKVKKELFDKEYITGEGINKILDEREVLQKKLQLHLDEKEKYDNKEKLVKDIKVALDIRPLEENYIIKGKERALKVVEKEKLEEYIKTIQNELNEISKLIMVEEEKEEGRKKRAEEIVILKEKYLKVSDIEEKKIKVKDIENNYNKLSKEIELLKERKIIVSKDIERIDGEIKYILDLEKNLINLQNSIVKQNDIRNKLLKLYKEIELRDELEKNHSEEAQLYNKIEKDYLLEKSKFEELELRFRKGQAGILALSLSDKCPCPVCGSIDHPNKAKLEDNVPREEDLKVEKEKYENYKLKCDEALNRLKSITQGIEFKNKEVIEPLLEEINNIAKIELIFDNDLKNSVKSKGAEIRKELDSLKEEELKCKNIVQSRDKLEKQNESDKKVLESIDIKLQDLEKESMNIFGVLQGEKENIKILMGEMPKDIDSLEKLKSTIIDMENTLENDRKLLAELKVKESKAGSTLSSAIGKLEGISSIVNELVSTEEKLKIRFNEELKKKFHEVNYYNELKKNTQISLEKLQNEIATYKENERSLQDRYNDIKEKSKGKEKVDLEGIREIINELMKEEKTLDKNIKELYALFENNKSRYKNIKSLSVNVVELEEKYSIIGQLAEVANGKKAPYITFESYVLATYFEQIIEAANIRLKKMTAERFILNRKEDKGKGTGQKGLDLQVFDNYTGKIRDVKTLSGGESFKASLALALGLSDVIQSNVGGIELDTMFIDEGFGTLDPESLDNAINCLLDLQKGGRLVGIISHVPELKERVEAKLEVITSPKGSKTSFIL